MAIHGFARGNVAPGRPPVAVCRCGAKFHGATFRQAYEQLVAHMKARRDGR